jgi:hypothetical protein
MYILEIAATLYQYYVNASGGVFQDHECVITIRDGFYLITRDSDALCTLANGYVR